MTKLSITDVTVSSVPDGTDIVIRPSGRWSNCAGLAIWLTLIAYAVSDNLTTHVGLVVAALGFALLACVVWASLAKEIVCLRRQNIVLQTMLGPVELDGRVDLARADVKAVEFRIQHSIGKGSKFVNRKLVLLTSKGEVRLRMQLSPSDGKNLLEIFQKYLDSSPTGSP